MDLKQVIRLLKTSPWLVPVLAGINALLWCIDWLAMRSVGNKPIRPRSMAVLRFDVLGDYVVFRAYLRYLKEQSAYRGHHLTLVGNRGFQNLAETLDADLVDAFVWVDIYRLSTRPAYRFRVVRQLRKLGVEVTFCPTFSRVLVLDDFMARATAAPTRVGCVGNRANMADWEERWGNQQYTTLLLTQPGFVFEVERNQQIMSGFLDADVPVLLPYIDAKTLPSVNVPERLVVLSLGAGQDIKIWPANQFAEVVRYLHNQYPAHTLLLTGAPGEEAHAQALVDQVAATDSLQNWVGKLSLSELLAVLNAADLLIANETGTVHLAAALRTPTIAVSQGKALVRWHPYPDWYGLPVQYVYPLAIEKHRADLAAIAANYNPESPLSITDVSPAVVAAKIAEVLG